MLEPQVAYEAGMALLGPESEPLRAWEELTLKEQDYWQQLADETNEADYEPQS